MRASTVRRALAGALCAAALALGATAAAAQDRPREAANASPAGAARPDAPAAPAARSSAPAVPVRASAAAGAEAEPTVPEPPAPVELRAVSVRFRANVDGVEVRYLPDPVLDDDGRGGLTLRTPSADRYATLCAVPCDRDLPQTHFGLAFARGDEVVRSAEPFGVDGPTGVRIAWQDRSVERLAGLLLLAVGVPLGLATGGVAAGVDAAVGGDGVASAVGLSSGGAVFAGSLAVGLYLVLRTDDASFSVTPLPAESPDLYSEEWR